MDWVTGSGKFLAGVNTIAVLLARIYCISFMYPYSHKNAVYTGLVVIMSLYDTVKPV